MGRKTLLAISKRLNDFYSGVILFLIFIVVLPIFVLIYLLFRPRKRRGWVSWSIPSQDLSDLRRQF